MRFRGFYAPAFGLLALVTIGGPVLLFSAGCGGTSDGTTNTNPGATIVAVWKETTITNNGVTSACPGSAADPTSGKAVSCQAAETLTLGPDGRFTYDFNDGSPVGAGSYRFDPTTAKITLTFDTGTIPAPGPLSYPTTMSTDNQRLGIIGDHAANNPLVTRTYARQPD
jgi:hypothetical protein